MVPVLFQNPPPSVVARFCETVPPSMVADPEPEMWNAPPLPGFEPASLLVKSVSTSVVIPPRASMAPPARLASLFENVEDMTVRSPSLLNTAPPEPDVPDASLSSKEQSVRVTVPPSL